MKVAAKVKAALISALSASSFSAFTRSILLITSPTLVVAGNWSPRFARIAFTPSLMPAMRLHQQQHHIRIRRPRPGRLHHRPVEPAPRPEQPRRVDEDDLRPPLHRDPANARPRRLHLVGDDGDLRADHAVQQRRFAGIRLADQRHEAAAGIRLGHVSVSSRSSRRRAASCWAARFEAALASARTPVSSATATVKCGAWSGPVRARSR